MKNGKLFMLVGLGLIIIIILSFFQKDLSKLLRTKFSGVYSSEASGILPKRNHEVNVLLYENSTVPTRTQNLEKLLKHFGYKYTILGKGDKWVGWHGRMRSYIDYFDTLNDEDYILLSDGRDVLVQEDVRSFSDKAIQLYNNNGGKIIFNGETLCCVAGKEFKGTASEKQEYFNKIMRFFQSKQPVPAPPLYTLNFGMAFGKAGDFKDMFQIMNLQPGEDDQGVIIQKIINGEFDNYLLDYRSILFGIMFNTPPEWNSAKKKYLSPEPNSFPCFIHFPGKSTDYKDCAKQLCNEYLHENPIL